MALQHPNMTVAHRQLTAKERQMLEKPVLVHVGIVLPDGTPHVSAMWVDLDGEDIILNTAEGRTKATSCASGAPSRSVSLILKTPTAISACAGAWSRSLVKNGVPSPPRKTSIPTFNAAELEKTKLEDGIRQP